MCKRYCFVLVHEQMVTAVKSADKKRRRLRKRWLLCILLLCGGVWLARGILFGPIVANLAAHKLGQTLEGSATVQSASGGWLQDAQFNNVAAQGSSLGVVPLFAARKIKATYDYELLFGNLQALRSLAVDGLELELDLRGRSGNSEATSESEKWPALLMHVPQPFPHVSINGDIHIQLPQENKIGIEDLNLESTDNTLAIQIPSIQINDTLSLPIVVELARDLPDRMRLIRPFALGDLTVKELALILGYQQQQITARVEVGGGSALLEATPKKLHFVAERVNLAAIPNTLLALLPKELRSMSGSVSTDVIAIKETAGWNVVGSLQLHDIIIAGCGPFHMSSQVQITPALALLPQLRITGPEKGDVAIDGLTLDVSGGKPISGKIQVNLPNVQAWWPEFLPPLPVPLRSNAQLTVTGETVTINRAEIIGGGATIQLGGHLAPRPWRIEAADLFITGDLTHVRTWIADAPVLTGKAAVRLQGTVPISDQLKTWLSTPLSLSLTADHIDLPQFGFDKVQFTGKTNNGAIRIDEALLSIAGTELLAAGDIQKTEQGWASTLDQGRITFPNVVAQLATSTSLRYENEIVFIAPLRLQSSAGMVSAEAQLAGGGGHLRLQGTAIKLAALGYESLDGNVELDVDINGPWSSPTGTVKIQAPAVRIAEQALSIQLDTHQDETGITFDQGTILLDKRGSIVMSGTLPFYINDAGFSLKPLGKKPARLDISIPALENWIPERVASGSLQMNVQMGGENNPLAMVGNATLSEVRIHHVDSDVPGRKINAPAVLAANAQWLGDATGLRAEATISQDDRAIIKAHFESLGDVIINTFYDGMWRHRTWQANGSITELDVAQIAGAIPGVLHLTGKIAGDWQASGNFITPTWNGNLRVDGVEAKIANDVPTFSAGQARLSVSDKIIQLESLGVDLGGSPLQALGTITLGVQPQVQCSINGKNVLLIQRHDARVRTDLNLELEGPLQKLLLKGKAHVISALFNPDISLFSGGGDVTDDGRLIIFELEDPLLANLLFDVGVTSSIKPTDEGVRIATDLVRAKCDLDLHLGGSGKLPELKGSISARDGRIFLPFSTLQISQGDILFPPADPFQPRLEVSAFSQVRRYKVNLQVTGLLSDPQVLASADGLDQRDALLLLTTGSTSAELTDESGQRAALGRVGGWLGLEAWRMVDGPADPDAGPSFLERVTLDMGRQVSNTGRDTIEAELELSEPQQVPGIFLYGERDRWDAYNAGFIFRFSWGGEE